MLPFLRTISWRIKNSPIRSFSHLFPFSNLKVVFKSSTRLSSCFCFTDKIPKSLQSGVIYKFTCAGCNSSYIGSTKRFWETRLEEHLHISALSGKPLKGQLVFTPMKHVKSGCCPVRSYSRDNFCIIGREKNPYLLLVKESILISTSDCSLNNRKTSVPLHLFMP